VETYVEDASASRPFSPIDAAEFDAVNKTNRIFDRWLRCLMSQQSGMLESPRRPILKNGQYAAPRKLDIDWQIAIATNSLLKEKPLP
jgi:hypothetical protein